MDTRSKILTLAAAVRVPPPVAVVTGTFDILRAEHARALDEIRRRTAARTLLVAVLPADCELLPQRARAEMVAALRVVDYVVAAAARDLDGFLGSLQPAALVRLEADDARRVRQLIEHVHLRKIS